MSPKKQKKEYMNLFDKKLIGEILLIVGAVLISEDIKTFINALWSQLSPPHLFFLGFIIAALGYYLAKFSCDKKNITDVNPHDQNQVRKAASSKR